MSRAKVIEREVLRSWLLDLPQPDASAPAEATTIPVLPTPAKVAVVDVRDDDHVGGHVKSSLHVPSSSFADNLPELHEKLKHHNAVVFHCALSQQRGPNAASMYLRYKELVEPSDTGDNLKAETLDVQQQQQQVYVLGGGFTGWQQDYGKDDRLTEAYDEQLWKFY
ncbi:Cdc25 family phosphatase-like protein Ibp1 [Lipomyces japonicus]|uniref:Cdc25 family phosphatase-like protein Ibp1 n=1 Tax=Lipomyces japonicus TaxID=56871 RepID=UPI0034CD5B9E